MGKKKLLIVTPILIAMSACTTVPEGPFIEEGDPIIIEASQSLVNLAKDIRENNKQLNILRQQKISAENIQLAADLAEQENLPSALKKNITIRWDGASEPAIEMIAKSIGYKYVKPSGKKPVVPIVVSLSAIDIKAYFVLKDIGLQLGQEAMLFVDTGKKQLGISYINTGKKAGG